jgi:hypothetical protein
MYLLKVAVLECLAGIGDSVGECRSDPVKQLVRACDVDRRGREKLIVPPQPMDNSPIGLPVEVASGRQDPIEAAVAIGDCMLPFEDGDERSVGAPHPPQHHERNDCDQDEQKERKCFGHIKLSALGYRTPWRRGA